MKGARRPRMYIEGARRRSRKEGDEASWVETERWRGGGVGERVWAIEGTDEGKRVDRKLAGRGWDS